MYVVVPLPPLPCVATRLTLVLMPAARTQDPTGTKDMAGGEEEGKGADGGAEAQPPPTARSGGGGDLATTVVPELSRADRSVLYKMGLLQLRKWVEQDEEAIKTAERESRADKEQEAKRRHEAWASMKDKRRIRVPTTVADPNAKPMQKWKPPRFDFTGGNKKLVRPKRQQLAHNTLQMLANSGLNSKYIHATGRGTRDLESCRQSLLQQGRVVRVCVWCCVQPGTAPLALNHLLCCVSQASWRKRTSRTPTVTTTRSS